MTMNLFVPITKVDAVQRLVYGSLATEAVDKTGEIFDYETSKPHVEEWSGTIAKATDGKSVGNLRAMHGKIAAGKFTELTCNDVAKRIDVCAKVVDDTEWEKVAEGVYTGFSIGGSYLKKWKDGDHTRYTAKPSEGSLVDNPCNPESQFAMIKEGGVEEMRKFTSVVPAPKTDTIPAPPPEPELEQVWKAKDGQTFATKALAKAHNEEIARVAADPAARLEAAVAGLEASVSKAEGAQATGAQAAAPTEPVEKREFSDKQRAKMADEGTAMSDGSYPIANKEDLKNAIQAFGRAKNKKATKAHIIARAKALKAEDMLPDSWKDGAEKAVRFAELRKGLVVDGKVLRKGLSEVARFACLIQELEWLQQSTEWEADTEKDNSAIPNEIKEAVATLCGILRAMCEEETNEMLDDEEMLEFGEMLEMSARTRGVNALAKALGEKAPAWLAKVGARHSKSDKEHLDAAHDHLSKMGVGCGAEKAAGDNLGKTGARHSAADAQHLENAHDSLVKCGADCAKAADEEDDGLRDDEPAPTPTTEDSPAGAEGEVRGHNHKAAPAGDLAKLQAENEALKKFIPLVEDLAKRMKVIEAQPVVHPRYRAVSKGVDNGAPADTGDIAEVFEKLAKEDPSKAAEIMIRAAHLNPFQFAGR